MIPLPGLHIRTDDFTATAAFDGKTVRVKLAGSAEMNVSKELEAFCQGVHQAALRYKTTASIDLSELEFMNSSCLKCFATLVDKVQTSAGVDQYEIRFLTNPKKHWQSRSMTAIAAMGSDVVKLEPCA
jgi:hypothetical protein